MFANRCIKQMVGKRSKNINFMEFVVLILSFGVMATIFNIVYTLQCLLSCFQS